MMTAILVAISVASLACASANPAPAAPAVVADPELDSIRVAVERALPASVQLLSVRRQGESIVLDISEELLVVARGGELEDVLHRLMAAASSVRTQPRPRVEDYRILVNGAPFERRIP